MIKPLENIVDIIMAVRVLSFDFDGCLFHKSYRDSTEKHVVLHNLPFLKTIREQNKDFEHVFLFIGSNRQSLSTDVFNSRTTGSCFPAIQQITNYLSTDEQEVVFDPLLLADVYNSLASGTAYAHALDYLRSPTRLAPMELKQSTPGWVFDDSKVTILYAQIHKAAALHPDKPIVFDFYDNRIDILVGLEIFFAAYSELIPQNVSLEFHHYEGQGITHLAEVSGTGLIDIDYPSTVREMSRIAVGGDRYPTRKDRIDAAYINPSKLPKRTMIAPTVPVESAVAPSLEKYTTSHSSLEVEQKDASYKHQETPKRQFSADIPKRAIRVGSAAKKSTEKKRKASTPLFVELTETDLEAKEEGLKQHKFEEIIDIDAGGRLIDSFFSEKRPKAVEAISAPPTIPAVR